MQLILATAFGYLQLDTVHLTDKTNPMHVHIAHSNYSTVKEKVVLTQFGYLSFLLIVYTLEHSGVPLTKLYWKNS